MKSPDLIEKNSIIPEEKISPDRRAFLAKLGHTTLLLGAGAMGLISLDFLSPNVLLEPPSEVKIGRPEDFAPGSVTLLAKQKVFIVRTTEGSIHALSSVCTHLGCITGYRASERVIVCPCHGSKFNPANGSVVGGPAPQSLPSLELHLAHDGFLWVNRAVTVEPGTMMRA